MLKELITGLGDLVYPPHCLICQKHLINFSSNGILCLTCEDSLSLNTPPFCPKCSRHLKSIQDAKCRNCFEKTPQFDFAWASCLYKGPLVKLIYQFKYSQKTYMRKLFAHLMLNFIEKYRLDISQFDIIVPIPLFSSRLRERGYNQSLLLAQSIGQTHQIKISSNNLIRAVNTQHQTYLSKKERWTNITNAFRIVNPLEFSGKNILIIDDLMTTGATASQAAGSLKKAGACNVGVLTLAITG